MGKLYRLPTPEKRLISQCRRGHARAQRELYDRYSAQMMGVCRRYLGHRREEAEEVLSNVFIKVFQKLDQYRGQGPLAAWIRRIAVTESLNFLRYRKNVFQEYQEDTAEPQYFPQEESSEAQHLLAMIDRLPMGYKTVFNLHAIEGYPHAEIAQMLGITENTSKSQLRKARHQLQAQLEEAKNLKDKRHEIP